MSQDAAPEDAAPEDAEAAYAASTTSPNDPRDHQDRGPDREAADDTAIPDDVETGVEELPAGFWDEPAPGPSGPRPGPRPATDPTAASPKRAARGTRPGGGPASRSHPGGASQARAPAEDATDDSLEQALLGGGAAADGLPEGLRDTVEALRELFPGEVLAVAPRDDEGDAETEGDLAAEPNGVEDDEGPAASGSEGGPRATDGRPGGEEQTTPDRTDAG